MRTIKKYELVRGENKISTPNLSEVVCATDEGGKIWVWMEVETENVERVMRAFFVMGCEDEVGEGMSIAFIGWGHTPSGEVVIIYEIL